MQLFQIFPALAALAVNVLGDVATNAHADTNCLPPSYGMVSWWRGEGDALDFAGTNNGTFVGNTTHGSGRVGQGFVFDGDGDGVLVGNPSTLQLQDFTIEAWIKRASASVVTHDAFFFETAVFFSYGYGGYGFGVRNDGRLFLTKVGLDNVTLDTGVTDTNFHHVAVTKSGSKVVFYIDGMAYPAPAYITSYDFSTEAAIGARGDSLESSFFGLIDELAVYNRALQATEIQAIYDAGSSGKCIATSPGPPFIFSGPTNQTVIVGDTVTFSVVAYGTAPLSYQWRFNQTNIITGATNSSLTLANVQRAEAGYYAVQVSNQVRAIVSPNAVLEVNPAPECVLFPSGLVSWWRAEDDASDFVGGNNGTAVGSATFGTGIAGQGFVFDGDRDGFQVGNPPNLQLQDFTIEAWIKRASASVATHDAFFVTAVFFAYGYGGYGFGLYNDGRLYLTKVGLDNVTLGTGVSDTNFHHVAATKSGSTVVFYVDGVAYPVPAYMTSYEFSTEAAIGARGDDQSGGFFGLIDELAIYNRALQASEIQAIYEMGGSGKCLAAIPPIVVAQPTDRTVEVGATTTFSVTTAGAPPLTYQWNFNGTNIPGAIHASLTLINVQFSQSGRYSVVVTNALGSATSSDAVLTVNFPPAIIEARSINASSAGPANVSIVLLANGNENAVGFSLNFSTQVLSYVDVTLGSGASAATLISNTNLIESGQLGLAVALPADGTFLAGAQEVVIVNFTTAVLSNAASTAITFSDQPVVRELSDVQGIALATDFVSGTVSVAAADYEGDVAPRPNGDKSVTITDWVLLGRYAARLDYPTNGTEFVRADCAPRSTLGDGTIIVTDWVQAGRYVAGLDPLTPVGGPISEDSLSAAATATFQRADKDLDLSSAGRELRLGRIAMVQGQTATAMVSLEAQGDENALSFSLAFDPGLLSIEYVTLGGAAAAATLNVNTNQAGAGKIGLVLALPAGTSFSPGTKEVVQVKVRALSSAAGSFSVAFSDEPVPRGVSDAAANTLTTSYVGDTGSINPRIPTLKISKAGQGISLSWPLWSSYFVLQAAGGPLPPIGAWTNLEVTVSIIADEIVLTLPISSAAEFYRLHASERN